MGGFRVAWMFLRGHVKSKVLLCCCYGVLSGFRVARMFPGGCKSSELLPGRCYAFA